jgi:hypothetical protein
MLFCTNVQRRHTMPCVYYILFMIQCKSSSMHRFINQFLSKFILYSALDDKNVDPLIKIEFIRCEQKLGKSNTCNWKVSECKTTKKPFLLAIALSVLLRYTDTDYPLVSSNSSSEQKACAYLIFSFPFVILNKVCSESVSLTFAVLI